MLIGLRSSGQVYRPFTTVEAMRAKAQATYQATEERLTKELQDTQQRLQDLENPSGGAATENASFNSQEAQRSIAEFNAKLVDLRQQLRDVRAALREDIDRLQTTTELANMALVPAVLIVIAILVEIWRRVRFRRSRRRLMATAGEHA